MLDCYRFALEDADNAFRYPAEFHDGAVKTIILPGQAKA